MALFKHSPLFLFAFILAAGALHAFDPTCINLGPNDNPASPGTCIGTTQINCNFLTTAPGCCDAPFCSMSGSACAAGSAPLIIDCGIFANTPVLCNMFGGSGGGCVWSSEGGTKACQSYGEDCSTKDCCEGLDCHPEVKKCTQPAGMCTIMPVVGVSEDTIFESGGPGSPLAVTNELVDASAGSGGYKASWFANWSSAGIIGVAIAMAIISLAAMAGYGFNLPEVKAFVDTELKQAIVSVLLIIGLLALIGFFDVISSQLINSMDIPVRLNPNEPIYISAAKSYLSTNIDLASTYALEELKESQKYQAKASSGVQGQLNFWFLLFAGSNIRNNAGLTMEAERAGTLFETTSKLLASLKAQRYFVDVVSFGIAPIFLLFGIVLRTFFFTRKLGGLLLAIAVSLFFVYPMSYALAWYTLNTTIYGERAFAATDPNCPPECTVRYPVAFYTNPANGEIIQFDGIQSLMLSGIGATNWGSGDVNGDGAADYPGLVACRDLSSAKVWAEWSCKDCPDYCRQIPFPHMLPGCDINNCGSEYCNPGCKIMRQRTDCEEKCAVSENCPLSCRTKVPLEDKCFFNDEVLGSAEISPADLSVSCSGCSGCPNWCRLLLNDTSNSPEGVLSQFYKDDACNKAACKLPSDTGTCPQACFYITEIGTDSSCESLCTKNGVVCPQPCRITNLDKFAGSDSTGLVAQCPAEACAKCPDGCKVAPASAASLPPECAAYPPSADGGAVCSACPAFCRRISDAPNSLDCPAYACSEDGGCTDACKLPDAPERVCETCFECPLDCTYYPSIRSDCSEVCTDEALSGVANIGPDDFAKKLPGAQGRVDVKNVGTLMIPALVMPLFCIVIVVSFIRVFSPILGGDIEIPGLSRII